MYQDLIQWSKTIQNCLLLSQRKWEKAKESFLMNILLYRKRVKVNKNTNGSTNTNTKSNTIEEHNDDGNNNGLDEFLNAISKSDNTKIQHDNTSIIAINASLQKKNRTSIWNASSIEEVVNIFLEREILFSHSNKDKDNINGRRQKRDDDPQLLKSRLKANTKGIISNEDYDHPLFLLLVGPSNSGKTYFCNMLQTSIGSTVASGGLNDDEVKGEN